MIGTELTLPTPDGVLAGVDFGGQGPGILLVHGSGHNAAAWAEVAARLVGHCRPIAVDLRGHGQTALDSSRPEQYWRDLGDVVASLGWARPVLVGHSTGGYAATAATAAGLVDPAALCVVDGVVLDDRVTAVAAHDAWSGPEAIDQLRTMFRYGWTADDEQMRSYVDDCVRDVDSDWLNAGARPELVREVARRNFLRRNERWVRRPTLDEIALISSADQHVAVLSCRRSCCGEILGGPCRRAAPGCDRRPSGRGLSPMRASLLETQRGSPSHAPPSYRRAGPPCPLRGMPTW